MKTPAPPNGSAPAAAGPSVLFEVIRTRGGWKVDEDGRLYGEYANEAQALAAARKAATTWIDTGGRADITYGPVNRGKYP
jgi:hypothetical protein